jgi:cytoskeletal protein CcmA (bactofilin family)
MNTFNNFSPLAFREKSQKATYKKWYAYGKEFALPFSTTELPPFQFTVANLPSFEPATVEVFLVNEATGTRGATGIYPKVDTMDEHNSVLYVSPGSNVYAKSIEPGVYRAEFTIPGGETYVSTPICVTEGIETNTNFVKLEYWNDEKLAYPNGFVTTGTDNDFKFQMYIPTTFFKPKYEFEEEITKRAGYKFLELQTCNKVFGFNFLAPEYICDALRLVRLSDYIRFTHDGEYYNALNFEYNPDWQDNGYLAAIECQFETDTIIQKLPSFNRRDRESFYNALLADIDTPILFSPDTVGLYYREFKQGEPTIKGKLIRELSPIDLIDENTTIAVDMGAGEARKFNLYRMLEGYISKNHEDVTEFLLSLRGGVNIGTPNASGEYPATIDRYGDAKLGSVDGGKARFDSVETGFFTVNNTAATIDSMGNTDVRDLTARGDSMLRSDVYTGSKNGSPTGKITKEGQLQYLSAIIYEFLSSETFVPGFLGEGFKIWLENGNWNIECDNLTVRQTMNIFELLIQKIRSVNGAIVVSQSNGKVTAVEDTGTQYKITFGEEFPTFQEGDLIRCQSWSKNNLKFYWVEVKSEADGYVLCDKSEFNSVVPAVGDEVVQMGNTKNAERQALIYITAQESGKPYIEILNGVKTKSLTGTDRTRLGDLSNIVDPDFTGEAAVKGTGFYSTNAFLKGIFVLRNGKRVEDEIKIAKDAADQAAQDAANAAQSAQEAKDRLDKWASDGFISPTEKPALIDEGKRIQAEYLQIKANADKYGVLVTEYTEAYNNYLNELRYHSAATPEDIAVRPELAQSQTAYYDKRNGALNAIADAAKSYVDEADNKLKEYLDTEITAIPGKIELAVRSLKTADTNLLKGAFREITNASYNIGYYNYDVPVINGKEYTLTVCYTLSSENTRISAYSDRGINFLVDFNTKGNMVVESKKVTMVGYKPTDGLYFFQFPNGTYGSKVHWAVLTDGNLGVTSWIPAASEKNVGLKNLCSFKRIVDAGFTYASRYDEDGTILMLPSVLHKESFVAKKDMFGLTYDPQKRYYVFIDHFVPSATIPNGTRSISLRIEYTDGTSEYMAVYNDSIGNNFILTSKAIRYVLGSYHTPISTYLRIGIFETNFPVSWSPAPEDQLYKSVKYTDTQILAVDGKISLSVTTELNKRVIGGANLCLKSGVCITGVSNHLRIDMSKYWRDLRGKKVTLSFDYEYSNLVLGRNSRVGLEEPVLKDGTSNHYYIGSWKYFDSTSLKADTGRFVETITVPNDVVNAQSIGIGFYIQVGDGTTMKICNPQIEIGDTATGWKPAPEDGVNESKEYTRQQISIVEGKITTTVKKITEVDGKVTGLASRVTQTESSINSVVERVDDQGNRLNAAEIKLESTSVKLGVVEGTANSANTAAGNAQKTANAANSLAGTANDKAEAADGRVTATQNGLVETGINITSRKIVLKSDNVLFQSNAGQQTAALNANGRLTANVIEAGEVVANGFAAQRITTGNLTVTDGAVIAGMSISGNRLTGGNITLTNGARIGSFQVSLNWLTGLNSSQIDLWAGANTGEGNNTLMQPGRILINQKGDNQPALEIQGKGNTLIAGKYCSLNVDTFQVTANQVRIPGVFFACSLLANATIGKTWGSFNFHITRFRKLSTGRYTVTYTGYTGDVYIMLQPMEYTKWGCACIEPYSQGSFTYKTFDANTGLFDCAVIAYFCGMPS